MNHSLILQVYIDRILSLRFGNANGSIVLSKPLFVLAVIDAIEWNAIGENRIEFDNEFLRKRFGQLYEQVYNNNKGFSMEFFIRPFFHLSSSSFYHLEWKEGASIPTFSNLPSAKFLRENLQYAKLDDELWYLLQDAESRSIIKRSIIEKYLSKPL